MSRARTVVVLGNPNVGKTSLFNALTGGNARVGNYPGMTIERRSGALRGFPGGEDLEVVDTPGTYSLSARSKEEMVALRAVLGVQGEPSPDALLIVVDAGQLSRCLYLALELIELRLPTVVAVNMIDEVPGLDVAALAAGLGVPCVGTSGVTGSGLPELVAAVRECLTDSRPFLPKIHAAYPKELIQAADSVIDALPADWSGPAPSVERLRALGLWALGSLDEDDEISAVPAELRQRVREQRQHGVDLDLLTVTARYQAIDSIVARLKPVQALERARLSEQVDRVLLHPLWGTLAFVVTMLVIFQALFAWSEPMVGGIETAIGLLQDAIQGVVPKGIVRDLLVNGIVGGVGNVVVFLPQLVLLFLAMSVLEDSGYMARIAYLVDRIMRALGLHGRAFVPMLSGFACAVPAILSTRTLERERDRLLTMLVVPLMTCSARLPVYTLVIGTLFPVQSFGRPVQGMLLLGMYVFSLVTTLFAAWVLGRTVVRGKSVPLVLELPPYRLPRAKSTMRTVTRRAGEFLGEAGTTILAATVVLWLLLSFPRDARCDAAAQSASAADAPAASCESATLQGSYGAQIGKALEPVVEPLGFDWKMATSILGAFAAREVFVSTLALMYGEEDDGEENVSLRKRIAAERTPEGGPRYTPLVGLSLMVFFALACQCMSTVAVVARESRSWKMAAFLVGYMSLLAYAASFVVYQGGRLLGF